MTDNTNPVKDPAWVAILLRADDITRGILPTVARRKSRILLARVVRLGPRILVSLRCLRKRSSKFSYFVEDLFTLKSLSYALCTLNFIEVCRPSSSGLC